MEKALKIVCVGVARPANADPRKSASCRKETSVKTLMRLPHSVEKSIRIRNAWQSFSQLQYAARASWCRHTGHDSAEGRVKVTCFLRAG